MNSKGSHKNRRLITTTHIHLNHCEDTHMLNKIYKDWQSTKWFHIITYKGGKYNLQRVAGVKQMTKSVTCQGNK